MTTGAAPVSYGLGTNQITVSYYRNHDNFRVNVGRYGGLYVATCNPKRLNLQSTPFSDQNYLQLKGVQTGIICN